MLTNGVLQANVAFDKAQLNCQNMAKRMMEFTDSNKWTQAAMLEEYKKIVNTGDGDAIKGDEAGRQVTGEEGQRWIGGQQRGGAGQSAIRPTHDLTAAGFNMMNSLPSTSTSSVSPGNCNGSACMKYRNAEEAARAVVKVLGDKSMRTCGDAKACTSGDADQQPGTSIAGTGFAPMLEEATRVNTELLAGMVNGRDKPTAGNLAKLKAGSLSVTAGVIRALQRDPDNGALTLRLAGELAMADTVETALLMRRMLLTGMAEPYAAAQPAALEEGERRIEALDREIMALKNEMELKRDLARNSVLTIIERDNERVGNNPMIQQADNADSRIHSLDAPDKE